MTVVTKLDVLLAGFGSGWAPLTLATAVSTVPLVAVSCTIALKLACLPEASFGTVQVTVFPLTTPPSGLVTVRG